MNLACIKRTVWCSSRNVALIETYRAQMDGKRSSLSHSVNPLCVSLVKLYAQKRESSSTLLSNGSSLHGLIWLMESMSSRPRWDLRRHQAHAFERHLFIFKMQMRPTSKAISCGEHTMRMCWSALPGVLRPHLCQVHPPFHVNPGGHTQTHLAKRERQRRQRGFPHTKPVFTHSAALFTRV